MADGIIWKIMWSRLAGYQVGDDWYYMDANGAMVKVILEMVIDGRTYRFAENGAMVYWNKTYKPYWQVGL